MFGKLASVFFEVDPPKTQLKDEDQVAQPTSATPVSQLTPTPIPIQAPTPLPVPVIPSTVDQEMVAFLAKAVEEANIPGFDYIEFRDALVRMSNANSQIPEQQKFIAVFATASTMGLTKEALLDAIDHYQGVLSAKKQEFLAHVEQMTQQEVAGRESKKAALEEEIQQLQGVIQESQKLILEKQQAVMVVSNEINQERLNIQNTAAAFEATYSFVSGKLEEDKRKIEAYIA